MSRLYLQHYLKALYGQQGGFRVLLCAPHPWSLGEPRHEVEFTVHIVCLSFPRAEECDANVTG